MTPEAETLLAEAIRVVGLRGSFDPVDLGAKVGLNKGRAEAAARTLSNAGVLVLGFDNAAHFTPDYRRAKSPVEPKVKKKAAKPAPEAVEVKPAAVAKKADKGASGRPVPKAGVKAEAADKTAAKKTAKPAKARG